MNSNNNNFNNTLAQEIGYLLRTLGLTLSTAESCTGGLIGHTITSISGCSDYFAGGIIAYSNIIKIKELNVNNKVLSNNGAVSEVVAEQMATGVMTRFNTDMGIGVTGVAGPDGGTSEKPVGFVFISLVSSSISKTREFNFKGNRNEIKHLACRAALEMLRDYLKSDKIRVKLSDV